MTGILAFLVFFFGADYIVNNIMNNPGAKSAMLAIAPALIFVPLILHIEDTSKEIEI